MHLVMTNPLSLLCTFLLLYLIIIISFFSPSHEDPRITTAGIYCGNASSSPDGFSVTNFLKEIQILAYRIQTQNSGSQIFNMDPSIYSFAQCMEDLSQEECRICFEEIRHKLRHCLPANSARVYLDGCYLRYDNYSFFKEAINKKDDKVVCNLPAYMGNEFAEKANRAINHVTETAVEEEGFAVAKVKGGVESVYALAQCWESVSNVGCKACLEKAREELKQCLPRKEGRAMYSGCYLRYSTKKFYNDKPDKGDQDFTVIIILVLSAVVSLLSMFGACIGYTRMSEKKGHGNTVHFSSAVTNSSLSFRYEILAKATDSFSSARKLGEGGSGSVFKGTLPDGRTVAVKRLHFNTRQWVDEFFNEVNLIGGIQHKNLIKLLGCSIEGPESLLVYEYLANASLDLILFDRKKNQILSWQQRFHIITGVAEGLAYLHGRIPTRIIHRDIKCSNILLDENMTPKIADFGLVRGFSADKTHLSTGIAGTLGYMAPEYLVRGQLTEKADVYSFGVLVIEIVCGRKNNVFIEDSVLHTVWNHYKSNSLQECVDSRLREEFPIEETLKVLQIGLLCTQASVPLRPFMSEAVKMLTNNDCNIPVPKQPPFLNSSVMGSNTPNLPFYAQRSVPNGSIDTSYYSISTSGDIRNSETE